MQCQLHGIYIASASSISKHAILEDEMRKNAEKDRLLYLLDAGKEFESVYINGGYSIYNLINRKEDVYEAYIVFQTITDQGHFASLLVPITIWYENSWVVEGCGERLMTEFDLQNTFYPEVVLKPMIEYEGISEKGTLNLSFRTCYHIENSVQEKGTFMDTISMNDTIKLDAVFDKVFLFDTLVYIRAFDTDKKEEILIWDDKQEFLYEIDNEYLRGKIYHYNHWNEYAPEELEGYFKDSYQANMYFNGENVEEFSLNRTDTGTWQENDVEESKQQGVLQQNQNAVYMNAIEKKEFQKQQDILFQTEKEHGNIQQVSVERIYDVIEKILFAADDGQSLLEVLETYGVYQFETRYSLVPTIHKWDIKVLRPMIFYNANDNSWFVVCGGYNRDNNWKEQLIPGDVGDREEFGIIYSNAGGTYDSYVKDVTAFIADEKNYQKVETQNRSNGDGMNGFAFEMQYVGDRWFAACNYGEGFENLDAEVIAYYKQGE